MTDFQQTVNLREKEERKKRFKRQKAVGQLENIYNNNNRQAKNELQKIDKPVVKKINESLVRLITLALAVFLISAVVYWLFFNNKGAIVSENTQNWYAVKLVDGEVFYGQIADTAADPVIISNVYYNYDQAKQDKGDKTEFEETGNLRLVKRGKETHGPVGTLNIVRSQVLYMEPLKQDSKVLQAILEYEQ